MRFFLFAAFLAATPLAQAQASFGLKGGLNTSFFSGPSSEGTEPKLGAVGGAVVRFDANPGFGIGAEALYSQKGARDEFFDETISLDYLEVPVYARLAIPVNPTLDAGLQVGGYIGIPVRATIPEDNFDLEANTDYGALVGFDVGSGPYYLEGRYSLGLAQVTDDDQLFPELPANELPDLKNQTVSLTFGVRFGGGGSRY